MNNAITLKINRANSDSPAIELINHRTRAIAMAVAGKTAPFAKSMLRSLLGLCPIAQSTAFDFAYKAAFFPCQLHCDTFSSMNHFFEERQIRNAQMLITVEAILETLRVISLDFNAFVYHTKASAETLKTLGALKERLWTLSAKDNFGLAVDDLFDDTRAFATLWFMRETKAIGAITQAYDRFNGLPAISGDALLLPSELQQPETLEVLMNALVTNPGFALTPELHTPRITGAIARLRDRRDASLARESFNIKNLIQARLLELQHFVAGELPLFDVRAYHHPNGHSLCLVETARGTLIHMLSLDKDEVKKLHIIAPTEWSFQNRGPMIEQMNLYARKHINDDNAMESGLSMMATAFDACTRIDIVRESENA